MINHHLKNRGTAPLVRVHRGLASNAQARKQPAKQQRAFAPAMLRKGRVSPIM